MHQDRYVHNINYVLVAGMEKGSRCYALCSSTVNHLSRHSSCGGLDLVEVLLLHRPSVRLGAVAEEVGLGSLVAAEEPLHPVDARTAELAAVVAKQIAAVAEVEVALPRGGARRQGLEVALGLVTSSSAVCPCWFGEEEKPTLLYATSPLPPMVYRMGLVNLDAAV